MSKLTHDASEDLTELLARLNSVDEILDLARDDLQASDATNHEVDLSFIVPVHDEEESVSELYAWIQENIPAGRTFEVIYVDDGSRDKTWSVVRRLTQESPEHVRGLRLRHNAGKATALAAGFRVSRGEIVFTMDGDLQDDPCEIPRFLAKLDEGYDLVSGWKKTRHDPWHKVLPSRIFNRMLSFFGGVALHDHNCGFKCYRGELARRVALHGELHRMVPCLASMLGYRSTEIDVTHHPRTSGRSKYGVERFIRGFSDMLTVGFLRRYRYRPAHFFNAVAGIYLIVALMLIGWAVVYPVSQTISVVKTLTAAVFGGMGLAVFLAGLLCEMVVRGPVSRDRPLPVALDTGAPSKPAGSRQNDSQRPSTTTHRESLPTKSVPEQDSRTGQIHAIGCETERDHNAHV